MPIRIISKQQQASGSFNGGQIIENKPIGFPREGGFVRPYSSLFYWARAEGVVDSTIGLHPHQGFEILSFVLEGNIRHFDTKNNAWIPLGTGDVQIIRAGSGIQHAEHIEKGGVIFQIWLDPNLERTLSQAASYDDYHPEDFPTESVDAGEKTILAGEGSPLKMDTPGTRISRYLIHRPMEIELGEGEMLSLYVIEGSGRIADQSFDQDDFIICEDPGAHSIASDQTLDLFAIFSPKELSYRTYAERAARYA